MLGNEDLVSNFLHAGVTKMNSLTIRACSFEDVDHLATMNKQLIEDEQHDNKMNAEQLKERMRAFMRYRSDVSE
jgi:hypothetical protein